LCFHGYNISYLNSGISIAINCVQNVTIIVNWRVLSTLFPVIECFFLQFFSVPVIRTHGTRKNNFSRKFSVPFSKKISRIFHSALPDKLRDQPDVSCSDQITQTSFHQTDSLALRRYSFKDLPGILPDQSFCETAVCLNNYGNDTLSHLPHKLLYSHSEPLFRHRSYLH